MLVEVEGRAGSSIPGVKKLSVGVIGAGDIARTAHLPVLTQCENISVDWLADVNRGNAASLAKAYKTECLPLTENLKELPAADVVLLACPYGVRQPYYEMLSERGSAIYAEKPLARTAAEHDSICAMFPDWALASGLMMRAWSSNLMAREAIGAGIFGDLRRASYSHGRPGLVTGGRYYLDPAQGGGGMLAEFGIHGVDSVLYACQAAAAEVERVHSVREGKVDLHTEAAIAMRLPGKQDAVFDVTVTGLANVFEGVELEFDDAILSYLLPGQGYALHGDIIDMDVTVRPARGGPGYRLSPAIPGVYPSTKFQMFHEFWTRFLDGVREQKPNWTSAREARLTTAVIEGIEKGGSS
ncbi:MAG: Gfo/Idh/MocA family oxidoreductase [Bryobacteraceae bacterium]